MASELISFPPVPSWHLIPGGLSVGKIMEIRGTVPYGSDVFEINFTTGEDGNGIKADRLLHLSARFHQHKVVRNAYLSGVWGPEEDDGSLPFATGKPFTILILVEQNSYKIAVDGRHQWEFFHRLAFGFATHLFIDGSVRVDEIKFYDKFNQGPQIGTCMPPPQDIGIPYNQFITNPQIGTCMPPQPETGFPRSQFISDPAMPFLHYLPGGLKPGMMISISGRPFASAQRFTINLQSGAAPYPPPDIGFHMDVRFHESIVVRNTKMNGSWESEERHIPFFPFAHSRGFDIILKVEGDRLLVSVNGQSFFDYKHRVFPYSKLDTLLIENDVILSSVKFDSC